MLSKRTSIVVVILRKNIYGWAPWHTPEAEDSLSPRSWKLAWVTWREGEKEKRKRRRQERKRKSTYVVFKTHTYNIWIFLKDR